MLMGMNGMKTLITDGGRRNGALQESEDRYRRIFENSVVGFFQSTPQGRFIEVNPAFAKMLRYESPEDLVSSISDIGTQYYADPEDRRRYQKALEDHKYVENFEFRARCGDGSEIWLSNSTRAYFDENRKVVRYEGIAVDITARKLAEEALRESSARYREEKEFSRLLLDTSPAFIVAIGFDGKTLMMNKALLDALEYSSAEVEGTDYLTTFVPEEDREQLDLVLRKIQEEKESTFNQNRITSRSGKSYFVEWHGRTVGREGDLPGFLVGVGIDITERKQAEAEQRKLQAQLNQAQKMESVGRLAGGVAHDFNNMLGVILGQSEMAIMQVDPKDPVLARLQEIRKAALGSAVLVRQLLAFARKQTITPRVLDLNETVESMLKMLRRLIGENIVLGWMPGRNLWPAKVDPSQIDQILASLCVNARDAIMDVGRITIETGNVVLDEAYCADRAGYVPGEYILLSVSDDGCGMDRQTLEHIFDPFFTTKEVGKGTGLGLATVYGIVKQNEGFIEVRSEPGKGAAFRIYLPRHMEKLEEKDIQTRTGPPAGGHETVLLVEDEPMVLKMGRNMLEALGYTVLTTVSPVQALKLAEEHAQEIHLLMTDVVMPEMNGRDLAAKLKSLCPGIKTLFMSGYTANVIAHHGVLEKGVHFMQKPFSMKDLADKVREALSGNEAT